jgi:hypothetical protein
MYRVNRLLVVVMAAGVAAAVYAGALRWRVEMPNRAVALVLDWQEVEALAAASGVSPAAVLERLRAAGATDVAIGEQHLSDLVAAGRVTVLPASAAGLEETVPPEGIVLSAYDEPTAQRLRMCLSAKLPAGTIAETAGAPGLIPCRAPQAYVEKLGLGWPPEHPEIAAAAGLGVVARMDNYPGASAPAITFMLVSAAVAGAKLVIFTGDQVLGYPGLIGETVQVLRAARVNYGAIELAGQSGDTTLGRELEGEIVRVHSITEREMSTISPVAAVERYVRAVRERNIRACYVRLFLGPRAQAPLQFNLRYLQALGREMREAGYRSGRPRPLAPVEVPPWAVMLMAAGAVAAAVYGLGKVIPVPERAAYLLVIVGVAAGAGLLQAAPQMLRVEKALLAAVAFPAIGLIAVARGARGARAAATVSAGGLAARAAGWLIAASAISLAGGIVAAGLLTERLYMSKVLQFAGVKLALAAPMMAAALVWVLGLHGRGKWATYWRRVQENAREAWNRPLHVWEAALAAGLLAAAAVMLLRSGNQPPVEVSGLELHVRDWLEQALMVRPRTKEFLIGHPALMLAVGMALRGRTRWVLVLLVLGAMGQASLVNTFCHLHTPLLVSLVRSANGLWLGLAIGAIVVWLWDRLRGHTTEMRQ